MVKIKSAPQSSINLKSGELFLAFSLSLTPELLYVYIQFSTGTVANFRFVPETTSGYTAGDSPMPVVS
jgi:hypothetical protein